MAQIQDILFRRQEYRVVPFLLGQMLHTHQFPGAKIRDTQNILTDIDKIRFRPYLRG